MSLVVVASRSPHFSRDRHIETLTEPGVAEFLEVLDLTSRKAGDDLRHPYYDRRLIEWSVSMPARYKLEGGWSRAIQRHAIRDLVPDWIYRRTDKGRVGDRFFGRLAAAQWDAINRVVNSHGGAAAPYVDARSLRRAYAKAASRQDAPENRDLYALLRLEWWLSAWQ